MGGTVLGETVHRPSRSLAAALAGLLLIAACSGSDDEPDPTPTVTATATEEAESGTGPPPDMPDGDELSDTLREVRDRGTLRCGVGLRPGFSTEDSSGERHGFDVDFCRAIAAIVLGDAAAVDFVDASADRFDLLAGGELDVLLRFTTWTMGRDAGFDFGPTTFHDGQRVMGRSDLFGPRSEVADLDGASVCVGEDTTSLQNIQDLAAAVGADIELVLAPSSDQAIEDFADALCDAVTSDGSALAADKDSLEPAPGAWVLFPPEPFSKEPLGPVYRADDPGWANVVDWSVYALIAADELGVTSDNVESARDLPANPEIARLLGTPGDLQLALGLDQEAFYRAIAEVGNYEEIFNRNLVPLGFARPGTLNASYLDAGLIYSPPVR